MGALTKNAVINTLYNLVEFPVSPSCILKRNLNSQYLIKSHLEHKIRD